ncbi:general substrate transporter [Pisolithus marmoratus]|nr:general substrate transporter [Pisolithus marmoratus]
MSRRVGNGYAIKTPHGGTLTVCSSSPFADEPASTYTYSYAYGPTGLAGLFRNRYAAGCAIFASIGGLSFGYDQGVIANVLVMKDFASRWPVGPWEKGTMTAVLELGALFGALLAGVLADKYSRRRSIFLASRSGFQAGAQSLNQLILGRAVGGLGVGALSMLSPLYMAEISSPELRGSLMALEQLAIVFGVVFGFWSGFLTRNAPGSASWRIPLALQFLPGISLCLGCFLLPPSPRFLVLKGRLEDAMQSLSRLRLRTAAEAPHDPLLQLEFLEMQVDVALETQNSGTNEKEGLMNSWGKLFHREYVDRTFIGIMIMFFQQWSGINALLYYGPMLVTSIGVEGDMVTLLVSGGIGIVQFLAVIPAILYLDKLGRKPLLRGGSALMAVSHIVIAILIHHYGGNWTTHSSAAWLAVICIYTFTAAYGVSFGPIGWVLPSEVFPLSMRSKGVSLATASNWINNFLIGLVTPPLIQSSARGTFFLFGTACFAAYFWSTYLVPETAGVSLEEMDAVFGTTAGKEDGRVKAELEQDFGIHDLIRGLVGRSH